MKKPKTLIQKNISTPKFTALLFTICKIWKYPRHPLIDELTKLLWDIYTMECYSAINKKKILLLVTIWMDKENIMLSEISQSEKDKYHMIHSYVEYNKQTELTRKMQTDSQMKSRVAASGMGEVKG